MNLARKLVETRRLLDESEWQLFVREAALRGELKDLQEKLQEELHEKGVALEDIERMETHMRRLATRCAELQEQRNRLKLERDRLIAERNCRKIAYTSVLAERNSLAEELVLVRANIVAQAAAVGEELGLLQEKCQAATADKAALAAEKGELEHKLAALAAGSEAMAGDLIDSRAKTTAQAAAFGVEFGLLQGKFQIATARTAAVEAGVEKLEEKLAALAADRLSIARNLIDARAITTAQAEQLRLLEEDSKLAIAAGEATWKAEKMEVEKKLSALAAEAQLSEARNHNLSLGKAEAEREVTRLKEALARALAGESNRRLSMKVGAHDVSYQTDDAKPEGAKEKRTKKVVRPCAGCETVTHRRCAGCRTTFYCDKTCQRAAWFDHHKAECPRLDR